MRRLLPILLAAALGLVAQGCAGEGGAVVLISGRDDHGLLEQAAVGLQRTPTDATVVGSAPDGSFARVLEIDHSWLRVRTLGTPPQEGWVNDHDLRGVAELLPRRAQVRLRDARITASGLELLVENVGGGQASWVAASDLREVGAQP